MIVLFTIGREIERKARDPTLMPIGETALAVRPGQPYPATFQTMFAA